MRNIIITVKDFEDSFCCDMEIPSEVPMSQVIPLILKNASALSGDLSFSSGDHVLICRRTSRQAEPHLCAEENGIRNGDYLILIES